MGGTATQETLQALANGGEPYLGEIGAERAAGVCCASAQCAFRPQGLREQRDDCGG